MDLDYAYDIINYELTAIPRTLLYKTRLGIETKFSGNVK